MTHQRSPTAHFWDPAYYRPGSDDFSIQAYPQAQDASSPVNSGCSPPGRGETAMRPGSGGELSPQSLVTPRTVRIGHLDESQDHTGGDAFARTFSGRDMPASARVLTQLDPNLHPSTKPRSESRSLASRSPAMQAHNMSVMSIHASTDIAGQELKKLLAFSSRLQTLENQVETLQLCRQYAEATDSRMQASIESQNVMLAQLCSSIHRLATSSTHATANLTENSAAAAAAAAATHVQLQQSAAAMPGPLTRAAAECAVRNAGYMASLVLKSVGKLAAEADVVAAILCHKILLSDYVPPPATAGADTAAGRHTDYLTLRNAKTAGTFLLVLEATWNITGRSLRFVPRPLSYIVNPLLRPLRVCMGCMRWTCWAALCYLLARTAQHRCAALRATTHAEPSTPPAAHTPASFATPPAAASVAAAAVAAECQPSPRRASRNGAGEPGSARGSAALSPAVAGTSPDRSRPAAAQTRAAAPVHVLRTNSAFVRSPGGESAGGLPGGNAPVGVGGDAPCGHGYAESCPHGCDVFGGEVGGQQDENQAEFPGGDGEGGENGVQGEPVGVAGYVMQQGLQFADAARAWASRSRNFVRV
eukprot:jgi/Ulvmu1/5971/UM026_0095.1